MVTIEFVERTSLNSNLNIFELRDFIKKVKYFY